ncbi:hypothetical protein BDR04DRAFT_721103 [Suillus decipiens]|nr:hypothetical protein BDR04DRAFT_721103 [Suillus decipiens]
MKIVCPRFSYKHFRYSNSITIMTYALYSSNHILILYSTHLSPFHALSSCFLKRHCDFYISLTYIESGAFNLFIYNIE